ncbi:hypothetical protein H6G33_10615 [Calothrix sp. FACHB-1219]|uniref:hypothetical protein n=1 Tax=unclassified Calothrix TaxID=2619626 RepID=UPI001687C75E|nr:MULTISPECIES: hypothetical protein [unclassified Calothrix]MBD2201800.1 hypothetical protein [Calothrix sp. FACHB-168]MBD2217486.1 hypothetical protein [Calothrix sp. FACHB-1219]
MPIKSNSLDVNVTNNPRGFKLFTGFSRPSDTTQYSIGDAITHRTPSGGGPQELMGFLPNPTNTTPIAIDLSTFGAQPGDFFSITNVKVIFGTAQSILPIVNVFMFNEPFTVTEDNAPLAVPDEVSITGAVIVPCGDPYTLIDNSVAASEHGEWSGQLSETYTELFIILQAASNYAPASAEDIGIVVEGYIR